MEDYRWVSKVSKMGPGRYYVSVPKAIGESMHNSDVEVSMLSVKKKKDKR